MSRYILPRGFLVNGTHCGIKRFNKDLGIIYSAAPCKAAGMFTKNKIKAAPLLVAKEILAKGEPIHAVIVNSGNANCCAGRVGTGDAKKMIMGVTANLDLKFNNVLVSSTGVIGKRLPVDLIVAAIPKLVKRLSERAVMSFAKAILTTDKKRKVETTRFLIGSHEVIITGVCKGSGMIHPNMATMLCFIMTDANIDKDALKLALRRVTDDTFNNIAIDNDMSTNDTVFILANGRAGNEPIKKGTKEFDLFVKHLHGIALELCREVIRDGEGATKLIHVRVKGAKTEKDAKKVARMIADSLLVKTSVHGGDPNWGRVAASVGSSMADGIRYGKIEIYLDRVCMFKNGKFTNPAANRVATIYKRGTVDILVNLNAGTKSAFMFTCDLSKRYVEINAHYMT
ncbi:MAG: bifunctional glutamate N-acetyltransferase/amino-acid acetyltransferase ArgJ [Candidatus Omnitrophica bacterium]|nr:bifunctional glutamate N-acetyltransferase/amino-acid acetyltransferase ArgJ [Candidatus Omnitrophota bacterium]